MKTSHLISKIYSHQLLLALTLFLYSCGSFQGSSYFDIDGIYSSNKSARSSEMKKDGNNNFSGGKIKDYSDGKVYNSKMEILTKKKIGVSGCVLFICQAQEWSKIK